jgi:DNA polymerase-3 subunit alpha
MITKSEESTTAKGDPCGYYTIEDTSGSYSFSLYRGDFLKFRAFLQMNTFVYIRARVMQGWVNRETGAVGRPRFQVEDVRLLSEVPHDFPKNVTITLDVANIDGRMVEKLLAFVKSNKGHNKLEIKVVDKSTGVSVSLPVGEGKIALDQSIIDYLETLTLHQVILADA